MYRCMLTPPEAAGAWSIHWRPLRSGEDSVHLAIVGRQTAGWLGVGFSTDGAMVGSDAVIGWLGGGVRAYALGGKSAGKVVPRARRHVPVVARRGA